MEGTGTSGLSATADVGCPTGDPSPALVRASAGVVPIGRGCATDRASAGVVPAGRVCVGVVPTDRGWAGVFVGVVPTDRVSAGVCVGGVPAGRVCVAVVPVGRVSAAVVFTAATVTLAAVFSS